MSVTLHEDTLSASKRQRIEDELAEGPVFMYVDSRRAGVVVPPHLVNQYMVPVLIGYTLQPAIGLELDASGIACTLRFGALGMHTCVFPWPAIYAIKTGTAGEIAAWIHSVPPELDLKPVEQPTEKPKRHLRSV